MTRKRKAEKVLEPILRKQRENITAHRIVSTLFSKILQPLVCEGFIDVAEVGRIAQVNRELNKASLDNDVWASLCQRHYTNTEHFPRTVLATKGYRWLYKRWSVPLIKRQQTPSLRAPSCDVTDFEFYIQAKYKGDLLYSGVARDDFIRPLCENGYAHVPLPQPIILGNAQWDFRTSERDDYVQNVDNSRDRGLRVSCGEHAYDQSKIEIVIHMLRKPDSNLCCVYDSRECSPVRRVECRYHPREDMSESITTKTRFGEKCNPKYITKEFVYGHVEPWSLNPTLQARSINVRLPYTVRLAAVLGPTIENGNQYAVSAIFVEAVKKNIGSLTFEPFISNLEEREHGVTLLHIFSELKGP